MAIKQYNPTTPGRRGASVIQLKDSPSPFKPLTKGQAKTGGRNASGRITTRHRGGGAKQRYREVDFAQTNTLPARIETIEYDPNRTAHLALVKYPNGERRYLLAESRAKVGQTIETGDKASVKNGNRMSLARIPAGSSIFNIQIKPDTVSTLVRSAGSAATLTSREGGFAFLKLPSGEVRKVDTKCLATIGITSNRDHENVTIGKAGRNRNRGIRPHVRGKAMNPVDHPHGGGEGQNPIGLKGPKTPSGLYTLGRKTRSKSRQKARARFVVR